MKKKVMTRAEIIYRSILYPREKGAKRPSRIIDYSQQTFEVYRYETQQLRHEQLYSDTHVLW